MFRQPRLGGCLPHSSSGCATQDARRDEYGGRQGRSHHHRPSIPAAVLRRRPYGIPKSRDRLHQRVSILGAATPGQHCADEPLADHCMCFTYRKITYRHVAEALSANQGANIFTNVEVPFQTRDVVIGGYAVAKGTAVMPQISAVLYDDKVMKTFSMMNNCRNLLSDLPCM